MKISDEQKQQIIQAVITAVITLVLAVVSILGYNVVKPMFAPEPSGGTVGAQAVSRGGILCDTGTNCVDVRNGKNIKVFSDNNPAGTPVFSVLGASGNVYAAGSVSLGGTYVGITPVATATAINTPTPPGNLTSTVVAASTVIVNGTPVFWATPQTKFLGNDTAGQYVYCTSTNVTNSATATPIAGATPVGNPWVSIDAVTGDAARPAGVYAAGTFTITVKNALQTPAANTTPAAVEWCYIYTK